MLPAITKRLGRLFSDNQQNVCADRRVRVRELPQKGAYVVLETLRAPDAQMIEHGTPWGVDKTYVVDGVPTLAYVQKGDWDWHQVFEDKGVYQTRFWSIDVLGADGLALDALALKPTPFRTYSDYNLHVSLMHYNGVWRDRTRQLEDVKSEEQRRAVEEELFADACALASRWKSVATDARTGKIPVFEKRGNKYWSIGRHSFDKGINAETMFDVIVKVPGVGDRIRKSLAECNPT